MKSKVKYRSLKRKKEEKKRSLRKWKRRASEMKWRTDQSAKTERKTDSEKRKDKKNKKSNLGNVDKYEGKDQFRKRWKKVPSSVERKKEKNLDLNKSYLKKRGRSIGVTKREKMKFSKIRRKRSLRREKSSQKSEKEKIRIWRRNCPNIANLFVKKRSRMRNENL